MDLRELQSHNVGTRVSELWAVISEPYELPSEEDFDRDFMTSVHGVFDSMDAANEYSFHLSRKDRDRVYGALKVRTVGDKITSTHSQP